MNSHSPSADDVVAAYEALLHQTRRMLEATNRQDWGTLVAYEADYVMQTHHLRQLDAHVPLTEMDRQRKAQLIEDILENNLRVRDGLMARRDELGELIGISRRQRNLSRAYGVQPDNAFRHPTRSPDDKSPM
ncbi:MAG: flagellar protein FliT [Halomonas sp.]